MPLFIYLSCLFLKGLGVNKTLSEALPLVSLTQGDNSFLNGELRIPLTCHPLPLTHNPVTLNPSPVALKKTVIFLYVCG